MGWGQRNIRKKPELVLRDLRVSCVIDTNIDTRARMQRAPIHPNRPKNTENKSMRPLCVRERETKSASNAIKSRLVGDTEKGLHTRIRFVCIQNNALIREVDDKDAATAGRPAGTVACACVRARLPLTRTRCHHPYVHIFYINAAACDCHQDLARAHTLAHACIALLELFILTECVRPPCASDAATLSK